MVLDGWMDGWMGGWMDVKAVLRIAYSNKKIYYKGTNGILNFKINLNSRL